MGDDDELGLLAQVVQIISETFHVPVVQRRIDLVQQTEGRGTHFQDCKVQRRGNKCLFAAGEQCNGLDLLSGGLNTNFDAAGQRILRIFQNQLTLTAAEHFFKDLTEIVVDLLELADEDGGHFLGDVTDDALQLPLGSEHVISLLCQIGIALIDTGIFLDST